MHRYRDPVWWLVILAGAAFYGTVIFITRVDPGVLWGLALGGIWGELVARARGNR